ncbi:MAG: M42 family metallopeptidase [Deinococcales bacterium]
MSLPAVDIDDAVRILLELLATPSPTGFTERALAVVEAELAVLGVTSRRTPKGALLWTLPGDGGEPRAVSSHIDTLGARVKEVKASGRLKLSPIGGFDWATIEGADCEVHTETGTSLAGTVVNTKQSSHVHGRALHDLKRDAAVMEVRLDAEVHDADDVRALGVEVGDVVSFDSRPVATESGFVKGRHIDDKAAVAVSLAVTRALVSAGRAPHGDAHFFVSNYEEVGHGAATGIPEEVVELLCVDMAAVGEGQTSSEYDVSLCVKDSGGPYDPGMNRRLRALARQHGIPLEVDIFPYYSSDATAAWRAGGNHRAALIGPGVDASHSFERTHRRAIAGTAALLEAYLLAPIAM